jgi:hypothetical protein
MADAAVEIIPGTGGGIFVDTRTEAGSSQHRQVVVLGDPSSNAGVATVDPTNGLSVYVTNTSLAATTTLAAGSNTIGKVDLNAGTNTIGHVGGTDYKTVAAGAVNTMLGTTGAAGDYLGGVLIVPTTTAAGAVSIKDGALTAVVIFAGGVTTPLGALVPFFVPIGAKSVNAGWQLSTGGNVTAIAVGDFT